jgi:hypothetical protein
MRIDTESQDLNLFRFVGRERLWEDNVTRGLLSLLTRSPCGGLVLRELLDLCYDRALADDSSAALKEVYGRALRDVGSVSIDWQRSAKSEHHEIAEEEREFAVLIALTPEKPGERPPKVIEVDKAEGRFDAILRCTTSNSVFDVVVEAKLHGSVQSEQWSRYLKILGRDRCLQVALSWADVVAILRGLPEACRHDPVVDDYVQYLIDLYWLAGFSGFTHEDFSHERVDARKGKLRQLVEEIISAEKESPKGVVGLHQLSGDADVDLYPRDQFSLLGNTGVASWRDDSLLAKLVIGTFKFYDDTGVRQVIVQGSGRDQPKFESYAGTRRLLEVDQEAVGRVIAEAAVEGALDAFVEFRCFFGRGPGLDLSVSSRHWDIRVPADWEPVSQALRLAEPENGGDVTEASLMRLRQFLPPDQQVDRFSKVRALLATKRERRATHHGTLVVTSEVGLDEFLRASPQEQVALVRRHHDPLLAALRDLSSL